MYCSKIFFVFHSYIHLFIIYITGIKKNEKKVFVMNEMKYWFVHLFHYGFVNRYRSYLAYLKLFHWTPGNDVIKSISFIFTVAL